MSPFIHKTLSFATGAAFAYGTYIYLSDRIKMNHNRLYNSIIKESETAQLVKMPQLEENIDYYDSFMKTAKRTWNVSIMSAYEFTCRYLTHDEKDQAQNEEKE